MVMTVIFSLVLSIREVGCARHDVSDEYSTPSVYY